MGYVTLPCFNNLHHVQPTPQVPPYRQHRARHGRGGLADGRTASGSGTCSGTTPGRCFTPKWITARSPTTKPHQAHPNHVFQLDGQPWVTRFNQRDAVCLETGERMPIDAQRPHDGTPHNGGVYFTTIDGHIVVSQHTHTTGQCLHRPECAERADAGLVPRAGDGGGRPGLGRVQPESVQPSSPRTSAGCKAASSSGDGRRISGCTASNEAGA